MNDIYEGGCHCGALRYRSEVAPVETGYCHCRDCQLTSGAPVVAWASFPIEQFEYVKGNPKLYQSSGHARREFCENCGTQIAFRELQDTKTVDISAVTLDQPDSITPQMHIFEKSRLPWFEIADDLPRYETWLAPEDRG